MIDVNQNDQANIRSHEVQEIVGQPPPALFQWGISAFFVAMIFILFASWFIRYPDLLTAQVTLTTTPPPVTIVTRASGALYLEVVDSAYVKEGQQLGYIRSTASPYEILNLENQLYHSVSASINASLLGELQPFFAEHMNATHAMNRYIQIQSYAKQIEQLKKQLTTNEKLRRYLTIQGKYSHEELSLAKERFRIDSVLFAQRVISAIDFNQSRATWLQQQRVAGNLESDLLNNEVRHNDFSKQVIELEIRLIEEDQKLRLSVEQSRNELLAHIAKWKETYILLAPVSGRVAFRGFIESEQFIEANKPIITIIPNHGKLVAKAELPLRASGKVKEGQAVNIRLENFPYEQFGMIHGQVSGISTLPVDGKYLLTIDLPEGLMTTQMKEIKFKQQLSGTTQIITDDLRLLDRFIHQLRSLIYNR